MRDYFVIDMVWLRDYYPFGVELYDRKFSVGATAFGFNGQRKDNEIYGEGNSYTAEFWQYDPRLSRRWNLDPKPISWLSSYSVFQLNPLINTDFNGDKIKGLNRMKKEDRKNFLNELHQETGLVLKKGLFGQLKYEDPERGKSEADRKGSRTARNNLMAAINNNQVIRVKLSRDNSVTGFTASTAATTNVIGTINLNLNFIDNLRRNITNDLKPETVGTGITFFHELFHANNTAPAFDDITIDPTTGNPFPGVSANISPAVNFENTIRRELDAKGDYTNGVYGVRQAYYVQWGNFKFIPFSWGVRTSLLTGNANFINLNKSYIWIMNVTPQDMQIDYNPGYVPPILPVNGSLTPNY